MLTHHLFTLFNLLNRSLGVAKTWNLVSALTWMSLVFYILDLNNSVNSASWCLACLLLSPVFGAFVHVFQVKLRNLLLEWRRAFFRALIDALWVMYVVAQYLNLCRLVTDRRLVRDAILITTRWSFGAHGVRKIVFIDLQMALSSTLAWYVGLLLWQSLSHFVTIKVASSMVCLCATPWVRRVSRTHSRAVAVFMLDETLNLLLEGQACIFVVGLVLFTFHMSHLASQGWLDLLRVVASTAAVKWLATSLILIFLLFVDAIRQVFFFKL